MWIEGNVKKAHSDVPPLVCLGPHLLWLCTDTRLHVKLNVNSFKE